MTQEQMLRGGDKPMPWLVLAIGYDRPALAAAVAEHLAPDDLRKMGALELELGRYPLHHAADADGVARTTASPVPTPPGRKKN